MSNVKLVSTPILNYYDSKLKKFLNSTYALKSDVGSGGGILYAECSTARNIVDKAVACEGFALVKGACIAIRFTDTSTADPTTGNITLNINNTDRKSIVPKENNTAVAYSWAWAFCKNQTQVFMYNGTNFIWLNQDNNTTYTPMALGFGYGTCTTEEDVTAKVVTLTSYVLIKGGMVSVKFANAVPASATLNINGKGAKYIYYHGAKILAGIINANDIATFVYDGTEYQLIAIDNKASFGKYNESNDDTLFSVGDGTADDARHNAFEITTDGGKLHDKDIATTDLIPTELPANGGNADTVNGHSVNADVPADAKFTDTVVDINTMEYSVDFSTISWETSYLGKFESYITLNNVNKIISVNLGAWDNFNSDDIVQATIIEDKIFGIISNTAKSNGHMTFRITYI